MKEPSVRIADLDKINSRAYSIKFHGVDHKIDPPALEDWLDIVESSNNLWSMKDKEKTTKDDIVDSYYGLFSKMCPTVTKEDISKSKPWQLSALWQICLDMMNGYEEKKTLTSMLLMGLKKEELTKMILILNQLLSALPDSSPNSVEGFQAGQ